jgi:hypothetical protein
MVVYPFSVFSLQFSLLTNIPIDVKTGSPDLADFAMTQRILPWMWHNGQGLLAYSAVTAAICQWSHNYCTNGQNSSSCFIVRSSASVWPIYVALAVRTMVVWQLTYRSCHSAICQWIRRGVDGCATVRSVVLRRAIFKRKKGSQPWV